MFDGTEILYKFSSRIRSVCVENAKNHSSIAFGLAYKCFFFLISKAHIIINP